MIKQSLFLILVTVIFLSCQEREAFNFNSDIIYPINQLNAIEFLWELQYEAPERGSKLLNQHVPVNGFVWNNKQDEQFYNYRSYVSFKNDTLHLVDSFDTKSTFGIFEQLKDGEDTLIFLEAILTFGQLKVDTNSIWLVNKINYQLKNSTKYKIEEDIELKYILSESRDSIQDYYIMSFVMLGIIINSDSDYWVQCSPGGNYTFHTEDNDLSYYGNDIKKEITGIHLERLLDILNVKGEIEIRETNLFRTDYVGESTIRGFKIPDFRKNYALN